MTFISFVLVKSERGSGGEYGNIVSMGLGNKVRLEWVASDTGACVCFSIDLRYKCRSIIIQTELSFN